MAGDEDRPPPEPEAPPPGEAAPETWSPLQETVAVARPAEPVVAEPERRSMMPTVLAGIGIVLIVVALYTLYNPPGRDALAAATTDIAALKARVAAAEAAAGTVPALDKRVAGLAGDVDTLKAAVAKDNGAAEAAAAIAPLQAKTADLDGKVTGMGTKLADTDAKLADQGTKLTDTDAKLADVGTKVGETNAKLAAVDTRLGDASGKVTDLGTGLGALTATVAALPKIDLTPLDNKVAALDKRIVPLEAYFAGPKTPEQATEARQNGSAAETRAAPLAVIAQGVRAAIEAGRPFPTEVQALATLGVDDATLAPLRAVAAKGAATRADLAAGFSGAQDAVVVAAAPVETGTTLDRIFANAQSIVKVNKTGAVAGDDAAAIAARIGDDLKRGDLAAASATWDTLPAASKARSADWADRLKARLKAEDAAKSIETKAVAALAAAQ